MSENTDAKNELKELLTDQIKAVNKTFNCWKEKKEKETGKQSRDGRTQFEKEYDKVLFSAYFRALSDKTQVVPLSKQDHNHNRLTHSLEVASVGYSFGKMLDNWLFCQDEDGQPINRLEDAPKDKDLALIIATACLLHDIGNPPFGHAGEDAIKHFFNKKFLARDQENGEHFYYEQTTFHLNGAQLNGFKRFDGNANGFRIATRLAGKSPEVLPVKHTEAILSTGLKLSNITLAAGLKYPFLAGKYPKDINKDKFGYFESEADIFDWIVKSGILPFNTESCENSSQYIRHPLVYLVESADDICNLVLDFEDAIINGHANPENLMIDAMKLWGNDSLGFTIYEHKYFIVIKGHKLFDLDSKTLP